MPHWKIMDNAPVIAEPTVTDANTRSGSAAAKGIAPSEIKDKPKTQADLPASRSSLLYKFFPKIVDDSAIASGGARRHDCTGFANS